MILRMTVGIWPDPKGPPAPPIPTCAGGSGSTGAAGAGAAGASASLAPPGSALGQGRCATSKTWDLLWKMSHDFYWFLMFQNFSGSVQSLLSCSQIFRTWNEREQNGLLIPHSYKSNMANRCTGPWAEWPAKWLWLKNNKGSRLWLNMALIKYAK